MASEKGIDTGDLIHICQKTITYQKECNHQSKIGKLDL